MTATEHVTIEREGDELRITFPTLFYWELFQSEVDSLDWTDEKEWPEHYRTFRQEMLDAKTGKDVCTATLSKEGERWLRVEAIPHRIQHYVPAVRSGDAEAKLFDRFARETLGLLT